ncbi:MAG: MFS transporter [Planctomycetales bacterium]
MLQRRNTDASTSTDALLDDAFPNANEIPGDAKPAAGWYYGWVMLPLVSVMQICTAPGQTFGISVFNPYLRESLQLSHTELASAYLLASCAAAFSLSVIGWLSDRVGLRLTSMGMVVFLGAACAAISQASGIVTLTLSFWMLRSFGQGGLSLTAQNGLAMWFSRRLGLAAGLAGLGMAAGFALVPKLFLAMIREFDWRNAYLILAAFNWVVLLPAVAILFRNRPEDVGQQIDGDVIETSPPKSQQQNQPTAKASAPPRIEETPERELDLAAACKTRAYWIAMAITMLWGMIGTGIVFNMEPLFTWRGLTEANAVAAFMPIAGGMAIMQLIGGVLADRVPLNRLLATSAAGMCVAVCAAGTMHSVATAHLFALMLGGSQGLLGAANATLWPRYFGRRNLGAIRGSIFTATVGSCSVGPIVMAASFDYLGGYGPALIVFAALLALASLAGLFATPPRIPARDDNK